jgi:hypothetical protein
MNLIVKEVYMKLFITKFKPLFSILLLLSLSISACGGISLGIEDPTEIPPSGGTPAVQEIQKEVPTIEDSPTAVMEESPIEMQDTATPEPILPSYEGWQQYANTDYGFGFYYPSSWTLEEVPEKDMGEGLTMMGASIHLQKDGALLFIGYKRSDEDRIFWTGMPAGEFEPRAPIVFLGQPIEKNALVLEGKVKNISYTFTTVADLTFAVRLDDRSGLVYMNIDIPLELQQEADQILSSFSLIK